VLHIYIYDISRLRVKRKNRAIPLLPLWTFVASSMVIERVVVGSTLRTQQHSRADHKLRHQANSSLFPSLVQMGHSATNGRSVVFAWRLQSSDRIYATNKTTPLLYGSETWRLTENNKRRVKATEMDVLRRSSRISRKQRIKNEITNKMQPCNRIY